MIFPMRRLGLVLTLLATLLVNISCDGELYRAEAQMFVNQMRLGMTQSEVAAAYYAILTSGGRKADEVSEPLDTTRFLVEGAEEFCGIDSKCVPQDFFRDTDWSDAETLDQFTAQQFFTVFNAPGDVRLVTVVYRKTDLKVVGWSALGR